MCIMIQRQTNVHCQLWIKALAFTEARKNQQGLCLNKDLWFKHTCLVPVFSEPVWLACVCAQLKITISIYLYQRGRAKKPRMQNTVTFTQILQIWRQPSRALTRGHSSRVNSPLTWASSERGAHLAASTTAVVHKAGAKVTQQACSEVMHNCSHPAPHFLHTREHCWAPYFGLGSLEIGFLKHVEKVCSS